VEKGRTAMARTGSTSGRPAVAVTAAALPLLLLGVSPTAADIRGRVFEDVNYGGGAGRSFGASLGVGRSGARVELYDSTGAFVESQLTDANGDYDFPQSAGTWVVRVVNSTVTSSRAGYAPGLPPVQTFRTEASDPSGPPVAVTDRVGGEVPSLVDAGANTTGLTLAQLTTGTTTAQSITTVAFGMAPNRVNINFGFNFDTIVNVNDSGQGSLRQYILNSNALGNAGLAIEGQPAGRDVSIFMISDGQAHPGLRTGLANLLTGGVAVVASATDLPAIAAADTSVDGTTQTANVGDTNPVVLGTGNTVGVDGLALSTVAGPEVEITGNSGTNGNGLLIQAANAVVRGLAIHGFGNATGEGGVRVDGVAATALIEGNVLGSSATSFTDPGTAAQRNEAGVYGANSSNSTVQGNLIGFGRVSGVYLDTGAAGWAITGNEIRDSGMNTADGDGICLNGATTSTSTGNLIVGSSSQGFVVTAGATSNVFTNNTVEGNGVGIPTSLVQSAGIVVRTTAASTVLDRNVIRANYGAGIQVNDGSTGTRITRNSFALNGTITARNGAAATGQIGIDLNSPADDIHLGTAPFFTVNDSGDGDTGGNGLVNFPILLSAVRSGGNLILMGFARPGSVIELFIASPDPTGFGEGTTYRLTLTEGGTGAGGDDPYPDTDGGTGTYGPGAVNGIVQGTDTTNRFTFTFPVPAGVVSGTPLTATATLGGETSEFSGNVTVFDATAVRLMSFTAVPGDGVVTLEWRTGSELDNLGFHLYRGLSADGPWTRLTSSLIPGLGSSPLGQVYSWLDSGLVNGVRYYYRLEDVDTASVSTLHGPVWAVPRASVEPPEGGGGGGGSEPEDPEGVAGSSCPGWVLAAYGSPVVSSLTCREYGDADSVSLEILSHDAHGATVELRTAGFWAAQEPSGTVRVFIPGLDSPSDPKAPALPVRRALVDAVVGKGAQLVSAEAFELRGFRGLRPSAVGAAEIVVVGDGTVRPARRSVGVSFLSRGYVPREVARLAGTVFQGERKSAVVEITPVRFDGSGGQLVLAGRVRVRLAFTGQEVGETGTGSRGRARPRKGIPMREVLARMYTTGRGLHAVRYEALFPQRSRGFSTFLLRLQRQGEAVGFRVEPTKEVFGPGSVLYFFADRTASSAEYSSEVAYELVRSREASRMGAKGGGPAGPALVTASTAVAWFEMNRAYMSGLLEAPELWLWDVMVSGARKAKPFSLSGVVAGQPAQVEVRLQGGSDAAATSADHHVRVEVNGVEVGEALFDGKQPYRLVASLPGSVLREGANELAVVNVGDTGVSSLVFLDGFAVSYPQAPTVRGGVFEGMWREGGTAEVGGLLGAPIVLDVTEAATWVTGVEAVGSTVRFQAEAGRRYVVVSPEGLLTPRVGEVGVSTLREATNQADYVVIGPRSFLGVAGPLLERRRSQGLVSRAVSLEEIASEFSYGQPSGEAIRSFLAYAFHSWRRSPRYVLLLGDATYDPQHFLATSWASPLPALWTKTSYLWTASDPALAAVNGEDLLPDLAIGRLPATTVEQAEELVGKLLAWEDSGEDLGGRAVLVADNPDVAGDFEADVEDIRQSFLGGRATTTLRLSELGGETRPAILDAFDEGASLMSYVGHGGTAVWASENVLNSNDAASLRAQSRQPLLLTMNCLNGYFVAPNLDALPEAFLKAEGRGIIAAFAPSGLSLDGPAHQYHRALMSELVSGAHQRLGDAILAAQRDYAETGLMPELLTIYHLFGDPATKIQ
jgi:hypothetical protein